MIGDTFDYAIVNDNNEVAGYGTHKFSGSWVEKNVNQFQRCVYCPYAERDCLYGYTKRNRNGYTNLILKDC